MKHVNEILVVHHSHTDWGYTTHQSIIGETHLRFIDQAVELCRKNGSRDDDLRYRWTCETSLVVHQYLRERSPRHRRAFMKCIEAGDIEVAALPLHPTPLANARTIAGALEILKDLRKEGVPVSVALGGDINGLSWPWADALLDADVTALGMAMNFVCGAGMKRWTPFQWKSAQGRLLLCWQGTHYNQGAYWGLNHQAYPISEVAPQLVAELRRSSPYEKALLQVTNIPPDNMGPHPHYLDGIRTYNRLADEHDWPRMRPASLTEWFDFLAPHAKELPVYEGDWTDWWASGAGSTPRETASLLEAQRRIALAERQGLSDEISSKVRRKIFLAAEHTWGASSSVKAPYQAASIAGLAAKQTLVYDALYGATDALRQSFPAGTAMHDPSLESFDPTWVAMVAQNKAAPASATSRVAGKKAQPDWGRWMGDSFAQVILEEPANGDRKTWYELGLFNRPEAHGVWPRHARWHRRILRQAKVSRSIEDSVLRLEIKVQLETTNQPRALYVQFPFSFQPASIMADVGGAWADPRRQYLPGSCLNWWTVHQGILLSSPRGSILWTPWDAPLVMFDAPCPNPPKRKNSLRRPVLVSWAMNTYWFTNFCGISGGEYVFRYRVKFWPQAVSTKEAEAFCESDPLPAFPRVILPNGTLKNP